MKPRKAILTFDLEFWYNSEFIGKYLKPQKLESQNLLVEESLLPILNLLNRHNTRATFFVLGKLAEKYPQLIKKISNDGHEVACHSYAHKPLWRMNSEEFKNDIEKNSEIIQKITGGRPVGFRAPNLSLCNKTSWSMEILKKYNFEYDSSISPFSNYKNNSSIKEIPPSLGGIYFRILPLWIYIFLIGHMSKNKIPVIYLHPHELHNFIPNVESVPGIKKMIKYWGVKNSFKKFAKLLEKFEFISISQYLHENPSN